MFAPMTAVRVPGRVVWRNEPLAREMGFTSDEELLDATSYRLLRPGETIGDRQSITLYADHYGGDGIAPYLGSARAGFTPRGDILLKGIGLTPLFRKHYEDDFPHSHGGCNLNEAMAEAIHGEVSHHLFTREPARILAIIDQDDWTVWPDGTNRLPRAILARVGLQLRPAHMLARIARQNGKCVELFERLTRASGQWVEGDLRATMLRVIDDHAEAVAEQVRWRITHGCISTSNMLMSGGMLDTVIQCAHPRIADIVPATKNPERVYFRDYLDRARQMGKIYRVLRKSEPLPPLGAYREMERAYRFHLDATLLRAAGFKPAAARAMRDAHPRLVRAFAEVLIRMASLRNPGSVRRSRALVRDQAVVDVMGMLGGYATIYFAKGAVVPPRSLLAPLFRGNRHHVARKRVVLGRLVREFAKLYDQVMSAARETCRELYDDMPRSIAARAAFENAPLERLYRTQLWKDLDETAARYKESGDATLIEQLIHERISASSRNVDALLRGATRLVDGGVELNVQVIDGVRYSVYAAPGVRCIRICAVGADGGWAGSPHHTAAGSSHLAGSSHHTGSTHHTCAGPHQVTVREPYGIYAGRYAYAMPDAVELREMLDREAPAQRLALSGSRGGSPRSASRSAARAPSSRRSASGNSAR